MPTYSTRSTQSLTINSDELSTICGMRGTGKTEVMRLLFRSTPRAVILDPLDQYGDLAGPGHRVVIPGTSGHKADERELLNDLCAEAWAIGNISIFVEEAEMSMPEGKPLLPAVKAVVLRGRNIGVGMVANTRRVAELKKTVVALSAHVLIFGTYLPGDIDYLGAFMGKEQAARVSTLRPYHFYHFAQGRQLTLCPPIKLSSA